MDGFITAGPDGSAGMCWAVTGYFELSLLITTDFLFEVMKLPSNGQVNGMMNGNAKKRFGVNKSAGILKPSTSCPNLTASDLNRNGYRNHRSSIDISSSGYPKPVLHFC